MAQPADPGDALRQRLQLALANQASGVPGYGDDLQSVAGELLSLGLRNEARQAVNALLNAPERPINRLVGLDLRAQLETDAGALLTYEELMQLYQSDRLLRARYSFLYATAYSKYILAVHNNQRTEDALLMADRFLSAQPDVLPRRIRIDASVNMVEFAKQTGDVEKIVVGVDRLFAADPNFGSTTGEFIQYKLDRLRAVDDRAVGQAYVEALTILWSDPAVRAFPQSLFVLEAIITARMDRGETAMAVDAAVYGLTDFDLRRNAWLVVNSVELAPGWDSEWEYRLAQALLAGAESDRAAAEVWGCDRLIASPIADVPTIEFARGRFARAIQFLATRDRSEPRSGLGVYSAADGAVHPEQSTVLESDFATNESTPIRIVLDHPVRRVDGGDLADLSDLVTVYIGTNDPTQPWASAPDGMFVVRGPTDPLIGSSTGVDIGISRAWGATVRPGCYAIVFHSELRFAFGSPQDPLVALPAVPQNLAFQGVRGAYVFRVAPNCDAATGDLINDFLQIAEGRGAVPPRELDANNDGRLDSCGASIGCIANFNQQGGITVQDLFDFLAAWFEPCWAQTTSGPCQFGSADVNRSGTISVQDVFDFLTAWFTRDPSCD